MKQPEETYRQRKQKYEQERKIMEKKASRLSWSRLMVFLISIIGIYISTMYSLAVLLAVIVISVAIFLRVVFLHHSCMLKKEEAMRLQSINEQELMALEHNFSSFQNGKQFIDASHDFSSDLNLFGEQSVFPIFNRTVCDNGEELLAYWFKNPPLDKNEICRRQQAVKELSSKLNLMQEFMQTGQKKRFEKEHFLKLDHWLKKQNVNVDIERFLAPSFTFLSFIMLSLLLLGVVYWPWMVIWIIIGLSITGMFNKKVNEQHENLNNIAAPLVMLDQLSEIINNEKFDSELLKKQQQTMGAQNGSPLKKLSKILHAFDVRLNVLAAVVLNSLFLWDLHQLNRLNKWKQQYGSHLPEHMDAVFVLDAIISLGNFAHSYPHYSYPQILEQDGFTLKGEDCNHILIPTGARVGNPVSLNGDGSFNVITGANMAGKSTYLRTVGLNMVLARLGVPLHCSRFAFTPVRIISSLSIKDSLVKNESFFYAELKRLQYIIRKLEQGDQLFCLLDEILKGTNSRDKQIGTMKLMQKLMRYRSNGIIATHDLKIGELEKDFPQKISNYCFEVEIKNDRLHFDYKLKPGIAQSLNASFLMKEMGITED